MASEKQLAAARAVLDECGYVMSDFSLGKLLDAAEGAREAHVPVTEAALRETIAVALNRTSAAIAGMQRHERLTCYDDVTGAVWDLLAKQTTPSAASFRVTESEWNAEFGPGAYACFVRVREWLASRQPAEPAPVVEPARVVEWTTKTSGDFLMALHAAFDNILVGDLKFEDFHRIGATVLGDRVSLPAQKSGHDWNQCLASQLRTATASVEEEHAARLAAEQAYRDANNAHVMTLHRLDAAEKKLAELRAWAAENSLRTPPSGTQQGGYVESARNVRDLLASPSAPPVAAEPKPKLDHDLPPPRKLTPEEMEACTEEARAIHARLAKPRGTPDPLEAMRERLERHGKALRACAEWFGVDDEHPVGVAMRKALGAEGE